MAGVIQRERFPAAKAAIGDTLVTQSVHLLQSLFLCRLMVVSTRTRLRSCAVRESLIILSAPHTYTHTLCHVLEPLRLARLIWSPEHPKIMGTFARHDL